MRAFPIILLAVGGILAASPAWAVVCCGGDGGGGGGTVGPAVTLTGTTVDFGTVRAGTPNVTGSVGVENSGDGSVFSFIDSLPANVSGTAPGVLNSTGQSGNFAFTLDTSTPGQFSNQGLPGAAFNQAGVLEFDSQGQSFGSVSLTFSGTVTQVADPTLGLTGPGNLIPLGVFTPTTYVLDLGDFAAGTGVVTTTLDVINDIADTAFSESLGGSFMTVGAVAPFSFGGTSFSGVAGGASIGADIGFDTTGLAPGTYGEDIFLDPFSAFPGLQPEALDGITVIVTADIVPPINTGGGGGVGGVPEPPTWIAMLTGFGLIGAALRRHGDTKAVRLA